MKSQPASKPMQPLQLVVCGTDTDVGKTVVSALLVQGLGASYWKPIQSGLDGGGDRGRVIELLQLPKQRWIPEIYAFQAPVSPHWAAELEHTEVYPAKLTVPATATPLVVETAGGLLVPLNRHWLQIDQLQQWGLPVVLVARSGLGTLNHTLLSLEALRQRGLTCLGLILNGPPHADNPRTLEQLGKVPVLAELAPLEPLSAAALNEQWQQQNLTPKFEALLHCSTPPA
jgi:dethiobiotin synthetase